VSVPYLLSIYYLILLFPAAISALLSLLSTQPDQGKPGIGDKNELNAK